MSTARSATGQATPPDVSQARSGPQHLGLALFVIATAQLMVVLDATIVNVALPHIQTALHFSGAGLEWVGNAIVAPAALSLVTTTFPEGPPRNRAMGVYAAMSIGGAAIGLLAGGLLDTYLSRRWGLIVHDPIGVMVALLA